MQAQSHNPRRSSGVTTGWFSGAPLSKLFLITSVATYMFPQRSHSSIELDFQRISYHGELYRLFFYSLCFETNVEMFVGLGTLCPLMIQYEREMGSRKLAFFLFKTVALATLLQIILMEFFIDLPMLSIGPYPQLGIMLYLFLMFSPRLYPKFVGILGFDFSEKAITYVFAAQVMFSAGISSIVPTICGIVSSSVMSSSLSTHNRDLFPESLVRLVERAGQYLGIFNYPPIYIHSVSSNAHANRQRRVSDSNRPIDDANNRRPDNSFPMASSAAPTPMIQPSIEAIDTLTGMGFNRESVIRALLATDNNVEAAANILLNS